MGSGSKSEIRDCSKQMVSTVVFPSVCQSLFHIWHGEEHCAVYKIIYCCGLLNQSQKSAPEKVFSSGIKHTHLFILTTRVPQQWTWQISGTTLCWSSRWGGLSQEGWSTSPAKSTSWSRWSRPSSRDNEGGELSRYVRCLASSSHHHWKAKSFIMLSCVQTGDL